MTKKNMFRIGAVLMVCVMMLSSFSFAATETHAGATGYVTFACSVGVTSSSASTSCTNGAAYCYVDLTTSYVLDTDQYGNYVYEDPLSDSDQDYGVATASVSFPFALYVSSHSNHSSVGCSGSLDEEA